MRAVRRLLWLTGVPVRLALIALIRLYRYTLSGLLGGNCRFYPSCSRYAEDAIARVGAVRGTVLAAWRVLRCSPLTRGGVDHPPRPLPSAYDGVIQRRPRAGAPGGR